MINIENLGNLKLALPENTAPDSIDLFSSSLKNKSGGNITHKLL